MRLHFPRSRFVPAIALFAASAFLGSCATESYRIDLKPDVAVAASKTLKGRYFIAGLRFEHEGDLAFSATDLTTSANDNAFGQQRPTRAKDSPLKVELLRKALEAKCRERHPSVFAADGEEAIPVIVSIKSATGEADMQTGPMLCGLTLGVVPGPYNVEQVYLVNVQPFGYAPTQAAAPTRASYKRAGWMALLPTGLIPYPGSSDGPKNVYTIAVTEPYIKSVCSRNLDILADEVVLQLQARQGELLCAKTVKAGPEPLEDPASATPERSATAPAPSGGGLITPQRNETPVKSDGLAL
jgi:hypothetical protein